MTPAVMMAKRAKIAFTTHQYQHDPSVSSYADEAAQALGQPPERIFKTLLSSDDNGKLYVAVLPASCQLDLKALAKHFKLKKLVMAEPSIAEKATGYVVGGISPMGQKRALPLVLDQSAQGFDTIYVSAGKRGLEIELAAADLLRLTRGQVGVITK